MAAALCLAALATPTTWSAQPGPPITFRPDSSIQHPVVLRLDDAPFDGADARALVCYDHQLGVLPPAGKQAPATAKPSGRASSGTLVRAVNREVSMAEAI